MTIRISGPGLGLQVPRGVAPAQLSTAPFSPPTTSIALQGGQVLMIPAGTWIVAMESGYSSVLEYLDPVDHEWHDIAGVNAPGEGWFFVLYSDGFNYRVLNTAQIGFSARVTAPGSGYVQATTTVTPSAGNSVWHAVVGGALGNPTVTNPGAGYTIPPLAVIPAPAPPGFPASAIATLAANGTVASVTLITHGAGYQKVPPVYLIASPNDPNLDEIKAAQATVELTGAGTITQILCLNFGAPLAAPPTLTITGSGTGATATVNPVPWEAPATEVIRLLPAAG